jgi:hypothetical protein
VHCHAYNERELGTVKPPYVLNSELCPDVGLCTSQMRKAGELIHACIFAVTACQLLTFGLPILIASYRCLPLSSAQNKAIWQ